MTSNPRVSVLTPIYNTEKYLPQCLDSLVAQTMIDVEFICINDGSTDSSLAIIEEYASRDSRFVIIDKPNSGYGASMNAGLAKARGEYIGIVEPDDYAESDMFERLYETAKANDCDLIRSNRYKLTEESDEFEEILDGFEYGKVFRPLDNQDIFIPAPCIWTHLYRRDFLVENEISFLETPGASFQDSGFVYKSYIAAERMILVEDAFLHYRMDNAASSVKSSSKLFCIVDEFHSIDDFIARRPEAKMLFKENLEALRYQAYQWNYERLGWEARKEFLPAIVRDLRRADEAGALSKDAFEIIEWDRIQRLLEDADAVFDAEAPLVSVIVPAYNCEAHIEDTLKSLRRQTLKNLEIIVVNDGSDDATQEVVESCYQKDRRIVLINQENKGLGGARNTGLDHALGKFVSFIDGEDEVPPNALEMLYRTALMNDADCAVGIIEEFDPIETRTFTRTESLSRKREISRYDIDLVWSLSVNNKLFKRSVIEDLGLRFTDTFAEDGPFSMSFVYGCGKIVGYPGVVLNYRRDLFWDGFSLTRGSSRKKVLDLVNNHEFIMELAEESIARDIEAAETELERRRLAVTQVEYLANLHQRLVSYLIDLQYRLLWLLDEETVDYMLAKIDEHMPYIEETKLRGMYKWHNDLPLQEGLPNREMLATMPLISVVVSKHADVSDAPEILECLYHNGFPRFELIFPKSFESNVPEFYRAMPNLHFLDDCETDAAFKQQAVQECHASMIMFFENRVFPNIGTLKKLWSAGYNCQADFVAGKVCRINREKGKARIYRSQTVLFNEKHVEGFSYKDERNQLDCSLNNKLIKVQSIQKSDFTFTDSAIEDCKRLYETLSFKKFPDIRFITDLEELEFLRGTKAAHYVQCRVERYKMGVLEEGLLAQRIDKLIGKRARKAMYKASGFVPRSKIAFFSNRGMSDNMKLIYDVLEGEKVDITQTLPHSEAYDSYAKGVLKKSKLIVLDDTCQYLRKVKLAKNQHVVQLWHALGAFKKFGLDNLRVDPDYERKAHSQYDAVIVSSEYVRPIYARALGVPMDKVLALGSSRTDFLLDEDICELKRKKLVRNNPEFAGKNIILYCPTFRQDNGVQCVWDSKIDWEDLSGKLDENEVVIVKPHPLERFDVLEGKQFDNIMRMDDVPTNDILPSASLVITDYSSVVFDAALLDKPVLFYCPDLEGYQTGFYVKFPDDLCGDLVTDYEGLPGAIKTSKGKITDPEKYQLFKEKFLGACDGHSTERIVAYLQSLLES